MSIIDKYDTKKEAGLEDSIGNIMNQEKVSGKRNCFVGAFETSVYSFGAEIEIPGQSSLTDLIER